MNKATKKLVFDGQVFQTPAWDRGMGKYSLELVSAINALNNINGHWKDIELILSKKVPTEDYVIDSLARKAPEIRVVELGLERNEYDNRPVAERNRKKIDKYLLDSSAGTDISPDIDYVTLSLMQSEVAPAFSSLNNVHNYLLFYDLIPLMFYKTYLLEPLNQKSYLSKLAELLKADTYLTISKTVANDLSAVLGIDPNRVMSIDGAPINHGIKARKLEVPTPFVLMPTGNDLRKNNRRGIEGFQIFNQKHNNKYTLVVTSTFENFEIAEYKSLCTNIVFTGNIKGEELEYLYQATDALLFPSEYEGLGLPILEALEKNKPVACSNISVFREMSDEAFFYFDPKDSYDIATALNDAVNAEKLPIKEYKKVINKYKWERTAKLFYEATRQTFMKPKGADRDEVAIFCATPEESSHGTEIQELYSELQRLCRTSYYLDQNGHSHNKSINYLTHIAEVKNIAKPTSISLPTASLPIYFIENDSNCASVLLVALAKPGVVVLKDGSLEKLWIAAKERGIIHQSRLKAEKDIGTIYKDVNFLTSLIAGQKLIIVHDKSILKNVDKIILKLPNELRPQTKHIPNWQTSLVYEELGLETSTINYPVNPDIGKNFIIKDFGREIYKLATSLRGVK